MNFNTGCATNVTFYEVGSNCSIFKQDLEKGPLNLTVFEDQKTLQ